MWYNASWLYRVKITVDKTKIGGSDLTNFPVYVNLANLPAGFFSHVKSDGTDVVVTSSDGTTKLSRELVAISTGGSTGELWFKAPTLSAATNTDFYIYFGNSGGSETNDTATWRSEFGGVYHMLDGADNQHINDSTTNANTGTKTAAANPTQVDAKIGKGQTTAVDKLINVGQATSISFGTGEFAIAQWVKKNTSLDNYQPVGNLQNSGNFDGYRMLGLSTTGYLRGEIRTGGSGFAADSTVNIQDNAYHRIWLVRRSTGIYIYEAGTQVGSNTNASTQNTVSNSSDAVIGDGRSGTSNGGDGAGWPGDIDETYFWKGTAPTAGWITSDYNNQSSPNTFYTVASVESQGVSPSSSQSPSSSTSASTSPSASVSPSASKSPSASTSPSSSSSSSTSPSSSVSPSSSSSASQSPSASVSPSSSASSSLSPSPSAGYEDYTRTSSGSLPTTPSDLATAYSAQDYIDVSTTNSVRVAQTGSLEYMLHQFRNFVGGVSFCTVEWEGQSSLAPSSSTVYLQIYNYNTSAWDTLATKSTGAQDTTFLLSADIADLTNYKDGRNTITCRVYQLAT